jgi:hypothetical protein
MAWTKEHWDKFKGARLDGPYYQNAKSLMSRLDSPGDKHTLKALLDLKRRQGSGKKRKNQKQSWNYG